MPYVGEKIPYLSHQYIQLLCCEQLMASMCNLSKVEESGVAQKYMDEGIHSIAIEPRFSGKQFFISN